MSTDNFNQYISDYRYVHDNATTETDRPYYTVNGLLYKSKMSVST